jgi:tryptophanase
MENSQNQEIEQSRVLAEPFRIKVVEPIRLTTKAYRKEKLEEAGYNPFKLNSDSVYIDFLTDSGTSAMSDRQWSAMMIGDESYAGARSWNKLSAVINELTGMEHCMPVHQGRAAERILYGILGGKDKVFISNTHFDTTRANIEYTGAQAIDLVCAEATEITHAAPFKGNMDISALEKTIQEKGSKNIAGIVMTLTNNSSGGQPVSMGNLNAVREICNKYQLLLIIDGCRIAENSYFVRHRESGYENTSYYKIAQESLSYGDAFIMSAKKDGLVNMGGILAIRDEALHNRCINQLIITEGFTTYGGLTGRDMEALAVGLQEVFDSDYLEYRIRSTEYLGKKLRAMGVPVVWPIGGHAVYIDAHALFPQIPLNEFPGQVLVEKLYIEGGIRCVEVGSLMFGKYDSQGNFLPAAQELVRLAIPRRVYTQSHIDYVLEIFQDILKEPKPSHGFKIIEEAEFLRHFTVTLAKI